ncbi:hypothetical protein R0K18_15330 [Pantoea sp. SIMBA_133]
MIKNVKDVKNDLDLLSGSLNDDGRSLVSISDALWSVAKFPLYILVIVLVTMLAFYVVNIIPVDKSGWDASTYVSSVGIVFGDWYLIVLIPTLVLSGFFALFFYPNMMLLKSIPESAREKSLIVKELSKGIHKVAVLLISIVTLLCVLSILLTSPYLMLSGAIVLFLSVFVFNIYLGSQIMRYGLTPLIQMVSSFLKGEAKTVL